MTTETKLVVTRTPGSHRGRDKAMQALGFKPQEYYSFLIRGHYWFLTESDLQKVRPFGATRSRVQPDRLGRCWPSDDPRFQPTQPYSTP